MDNNTLNKEVLDSKKDNDSLKSAEINTKLKNKNIQNNSNSIGKGFSKSNLVTRNLLGRNFQSVHHFKPMLNSLEQTMGSVSTSSVDEQGSYNDEYNVLNSDNEINGKGIFSGLLIKSSLKTKLVIFGVVFAFVSLFVFLVVLITPLMELNIINIEGIGSSSYLSTYVNPSYAYCESINVDGNLYDLEEYVAGVVEAEFGMYLSSGIDEALKAYAIAARTYALYYTNGCKNPMESGENTQNFNSTPSVAAQVIANDTKGIVLKYENDLFSSKYNSACYGDSPCFDLVMNDDNSYSVTYKSLPNNVNKTITLDRSYYEQVNDDEDNLQMIIQLFSFQCANEGMNYEEILDAIYSDGVDRVLLKKLLIGTESNVEGLDYIGTYTNLKSGKTYKNYKQYLYRNDVFTFEGSDHLASVGCGTNSAAIVLSGEDSSITPALLYIENGYKVGTYFGDYYPYGKQNFNYCNSWKSGYCIETKSSTKLNNNDMKEKLISNLNDGGTAILFVNYAADKCLINGKVWTQSQHYFAALDYNEVDNTIYISNPGNNSSSQNGWLSLDMFDCVHLAWLLYSK